MIEEERDQITNFGDAMNATMQDVEADGIANEEQIPDEEIPFTDEPGEEQLPQEQPIDDMQQVGDKALELAETATQAAQQKDSELQQILAQMQDMQQQNEQMRAAMEQMSQQQEEAIIEEVVEFPTLDVSSLMYDDEDVAMQKQREYAEGIARISEQNTLKKLQPFIDQAEQAKSQAEKTNVVNSLAKVPEFAGFSEILPQIENIIANNKAIQGGDLTEQYITAYAIARGVNAMNEQPKDITPDDFLEMYKSNDEFQKAVEKARIEKVKGGQQVPNLSASSGAVNAALNISSKPKTFDDAKNETLKMFGM